MHKKFTPKGLVLIFSILILGFIFVFFEKTGKIDEYFKKKYPVVEIPKLPPPKIYKIGFVTDAHARARKIGDVRPESEIPMQDFVSKMNDCFHPDFVVDGGDFIDGTRRFGAESKKDITLFKDIFQQLTAPKYHTIGNHELRGLTRDEWVRMNNYEKSYYYFDYDKLRVIIFDSTLITESDESTPEGQEYKKELEWLEDLLKNSDGYKKIVFSHHPLVPILRKTTPLEKITQLNNLFSQYGVRAVFSGHVEVLYYEKIGGVKYFITPGFYRSEAIGFAWLESHSQIEIGLDTKLKLFYKKSYNENYSTIIVPSTEYDDVEKEELKKVNFLDSVDFD